MLAATVVICLSVLIINRGPLFYFDTGSYFRQGNVALSMVLPPASRETGETAASKRPKAEVADEDDTAGGSRSMAYALLVAAFWRADALAGVAVVQLAAVLLAVWLAMRMLQRTADTGRSTLELVTIPLLAAATTSLPFYVAYVMPDIFAAIMLILIAAVVAAGSQMRLAEGLAVLALGAFAVVLHSSHMGIAVLMVPIAVIAALLRRGQGRWIAAAFSLGLAVIAIAERKVFEVAVETATKKEVMYTPHITARLIVDGPGMAYLEETCPQTDLATCALYEALSWSDDPYRLTAAHIIFERSKRLGSFRLMQPEDQKAVAAEQREFFFRVLANRPVATVLALGQNAVDQLGSNSVVMTIPSGPVIRNAKSLSGLPEEKLVVLDNIRLTRDPSWLEPADTIHTAIYLISFAIVAWILVRPGQVAPQMKVFALFLLIGIAVNALVCGGVSQPAPRYGARVIWLLPFAAAFLLLVRRHPKPRSDARSAV
ncbi:cytochrome d ubiquinol oxidase subunit II [Ruegeria sediminis]|uniref:Cytochrome d ubiquinol oxidase subunit II n=1 Tax=Ruegeria sediminis TaxID=2583820 RepID=A0ABY2WWY6_9RHOB|nr:cytochrome d ubiquinol oxidase subunit II [Ruegeria sediminis]TMV07025.1 cytochrome d ubiquinol oxidase subunit II [Ruegeria sediminis]